MVGVAKRDAGLGKGLGAGDAKGAREGVAFVTPRASGNPELRGRVARPWAPAFAGATEKIM
jgi:hypothetical protein